MYKLVLGLFLITFQVGCHGAPGLKMKLKHVVKRAVCTKDQLEEYSSCAQWKESGYCERQHQYYEYVSARCQKSCGLCEPRPTPPPKAPPTLPPQACKENEKDKSFGCTSWKNKGYCKNELYHRFMKENCYVTCGYCIARPTPPPKVDPDACLQAHNAERARHSGTPPLKWNETLAKHAEKWAKYLASNDKFEHEKNTGEGENLYYSYGSPVTTCKDAVTAWYDEIKDYDYSNPGFSSKTGHFTAVIWKSTTHVGAALAKSQDGTKTYVVARYSPPGNVLGKFQENVLPQTS